MMADEQTPVTAPAEATTATEPKAKPHKQVKVGRVVSNKNDKTVVVAVDYLRRHRIYKKMMRRTSKFHAHDENNECQMGDLVRIIESRPLSKLKRWRVDEIIKRAEQV
jgi:small subunit ribosomal protein S17